MAWLEKRKANEVISLIMVPDLEETLIPDNFEEEEKHSISQFLKDLKERTMQDYNKLIKGTALDLTCDLSLARFEGITAHNEALQ